MEVAPDALERRRVSRSRLAITSVALAAPLVAILAWPSLANATQSAPAAGTVFVTSLSANTVTEISPTTHQVTVIGGSGHGLNGPLGIAIAPDGQTAYVTNSLGDTVTLIDLTTSPPSLGALIRVGNAPSAIAISASGSSAYVSNFDTDTVTPINLRTNPPTPGPPIKVGSGPWSIAVSPDGRTVCVSNSEANTVSVINTASRAVTTVNVGNRPQAIAIAPNGSTAYVAAGNAVTPIRLTTSPPSAGAAIAIPNGPLGVAVSPDGATAYTANNDSTFTPIDLTSNPPRTEAPVQVGALTQPDGIAISPSGSTAYAANASNTVTPVNLTTSPATPETPIQVGSPSFGIAIAPGEPPIARLHITPGAAGKATLFDATGSTVPGGKVATYRWDFGDGTTVTTKVPTTSHVYVHSGSYAVTLTETSTDGTSLRRVFTGQTVSNNGSATARAAQSIRVFSAMSTSPSSGPPGVAVTLRDATFDSTCRPVYIFFDDQLIAQTTPSGRVLFDRRLVIPGDATLGAHKLSLSCSTKRTFLLSSPFLVVATHNHLTEFSVAMPGPSELKKHLVASGGISIAMLLLSRIIGAGFPSEWLDTTYAENRHRIQARARRRFPKLFINREQERSNAERFWGGLVIFLAFIGAAGLINSFLDPGFGFNRSSLWLLLGQCLGVSIVTMTGQIPIIIGGLREKRRIHMEVLIGGLVIALACVVTSRLAGLSPGYCYGLIAVFALRPHTDEKDWGRLHFISSVCVLSVSTIAFFLTVPVFHAATAHHPSPIWLILDPALNAVFLLGFASLAFGMFPLPFLPGRHVAKWNRAAWLAITTVGVVGFVAVLLSPGSGSPDELKHIALLPLIVAFVVFALLSLSFMLYFHLHPSSAPGHGETAHDETIHPEPPLAEA